nr:MAG TPA: hypothetical protein [Caudoviricetes sp.]
MFTIDMFVFTRKKVVFFLLANGEIEIMRASAIFFRFLVHF